MQPNQQETAYLWDMLEAAKEISDFTKGLTFEQYLKDRKIQRAVERSVEIIGEAARNISESYQQAHSEIAWRKIIAQRHVLAHEYGDIKQELMWELVEKHIPELISLLEPLIPPLPPNLKA